MTHQYDPLRLPDTEFLPGALRYIVPGNKGRLLDPRRTPVSIQGIDEQAGFILFRIEGFEDEGAVWEIPFEDIKHYQFEKGAHSASCNIIDGFQRQILDLDKNLSVECNLDDGVRSSKAIADHAEDARTFIAKSPDLKQAAATLDPTHLTGTGVLAQGLKRFMERDGLWEVEDALATRWVSNPASGELVKGHRIVLAEMGLAPYSGRAPRSDRIFEGIWHKESRRRHIVHRLGYLRALFDLARLDELSVYRGMTFETNYEPPRDATFISATTNIETAMSCFGEHVRTDKGVLFRQRVPLSRIFMTYLETDQMNRHYKESEVVLFYDADNPLF